MKTTDEVIQATFLTADDIQFKREQARKRAPKQQLPEQLPDGPCCGRCEHWSAPAIGDEDGFGACAFLHVITGGSERGIVVSDFEARQRATPPPLEPLAIRGFAAPCGAYRSIEREAIA